MSAEVYGRDPVNAPLVHMVSQQVADILVFTGERPDVAFTIGTRAAEYATEILLTAMDQTGEKQTGALTDNDFIELVRRVGATTINPELRFEYFEDIEVGTVRNTKIPTRQLPLMSDFKPGDFSRRAK